MVLNAEKIFYKIERIGCSGKSPDGICLRVCRAEG